MQDRIDGWQLKCANRVKKTESRNVLGSFLVPLSVKFAREQFLKLNNAKVCMCVCVLLTCATFCCFGDHFLPQIRLFVSCSPFNAYIWVLSVYTLPYTSASFCRLLQHISFSFVRSVCCTTDSFDLCYSVDAVAKLLHRNSMLKCKFLVDPIW